MEKKNLKELEQEVLLQEIEVREQKMLKMKKAILNEKANKQNIRNRISAKKSRKQELEREIDNIIAGKSKIELHSSSHDDIERQYTVTVNQIEELEKEWKDSDNMITVTNRERDLVHYELSFYREERNRRKRNQSGRMKTSIMIWNTDEEYIERLVRQNDTIDGKIGLLSFAAELLANGYYDNKIAAVDTRKKKVNIYSENIEKATEKAKALGYKTLSDALHDIIRHEDKNRKKLLRGEIDDTSIFFNNFKTTDETANGSEQTED